MFTAKDVQKLRESTGCGMMDCKKALTEAGGDFDKAIQVLREKGLAAVAKKAGRIAAEGVIAVYTAGNATAIVEVNCETDFVGKAPEFVGFANGLAQIVAETNPSTNEDVMAAKFPGSEFTAAEMLQEKVLKIGENIQFRRFTRYEGPVVTYIHGGGRIGVMVALDCDNQTAQNPQTIEYGKDIAMQITAMTPVYLDRASVPADVIASEMEIYTAQSVNEGKPAQIAEKIANGRMNKFYKTNCLMEQEFVKDDAMDITEYTANTCRKIGASVGVKAFTRYERGEGIQKREENFAEEIAKLVK